MYRLILGLLLGASFLMTVPACNTTKGVGQDMQSGGQSIQKSAEKHGATSD